MTNSEFDTIEGDDGFRWVWDNPANAEQRVGPIAHKSKRAALAAGRKWLEERNAR